MREVKPTQKPVPSSDIKDLFFNSGLLDIWATSLEPKYIDRFGNCHLTAAGMEWLFKELVEKFKVDMNTAIVAAGYITVDSFQQGADLPNNELTQRNHILRDEATGEYYRWDGDLPKQVPAGSTPESTGGIGKGAWVSVGDASLRGDLSVVIKSRNDSAHEKISSIYSDNKLTISTWNIQSYDVIDKRYNRDMTDQKRFFDLSDFISKSGSHIVCMQECYNGVGAEMSNLAVEPYMDSYFGSEEVRPASSAMMTGYFAGNSVISRYKTHDSNTIRITDEGGYHRVATASYIDHPEFGRVAIYNVHGGWFEANNLDFYNIIIGDYKGKGIQRVVICGDFNHDNSQWFSPLFSEGFVAVNNKTYNTKNTSDGSMWYIDNVLYKGFSVESVSVYSPHLTLSDHKMLTVTLK
ncbi:endonuclease/exonuclease/phosphatase family protein [Providencia rettgeri]|nr:endonuclease/exonuclease/phosphatase family protein [Providencia rettgeri]ELR5259965.1 endonuclease/exonuclease/phosphatase family protein [Providencia rettgeri]